MFKTLLMSAAALAVVALSPAAKALDWSDTSVSYRVGTEFREPGVTKSGGDAASVTKNIFALTHVNTYTYGGNFLNVDLLKSNSSDPANHSNTGAVEVYAVYRHDLSFNKVSGSKTFSFGPVRDVGLQAGVDANTKNTAFASRKFMPVIGPVVSFDVPGFFTVAVLYDKEWNNNGIVGRSVTFDGTAMLATTWGIPLGEIGAPVSFEGFATVNGPKGKDGFNRDTKTEILARPKLMWDVGAAFGQPKTIKAGFGWQYWLNKFGNDHDKVKGAKESTPFFEAQFHF